LSDSSNTLTPENGEERHMFIWVGTILDLNEKIKFKPSLIGRFVNGAPVSLDGNATFILYDKVWLGVLYRLDVTWGGLARWQINDKIQLGYSCNLNSSRFGCFGTGTHEIYISYIFIKHEQRILSPRYF
jgi:type IX secretion system PorP/SprF family membrane protein